MLSICWTTKTNCASTSPPLFEYALLILLALLWGASYSLIKIALVSFPPLTLMAIRVSIAAVLLTIMAKHAGHCFPTSQKTWAALLVQSFFNSIGAWTVLAWGQQYVDSGLAGVLNSTSPIFVVLLTLLWTRHESIGMVKLLGAVLGMTGVILLVGIDVLSNLGRQVIPQLAVLLGALFYGCAAIYGRQFKNLPASITAATTMIWASVWLVPIALLVEKPWEFQIETTALLAALALSVFSTAGALLLYFRLISTIGSIGVASQSYLRSAIAMLIGIFMLGESFTWSLGFGVIVIIIGMFLINSGSMVFREKIQKIV